jgi:hypothetical protein
MLISEKNRTETLEDRLIQVNWYHMIFNVFSWFQEIFSLAWALSLAWAGGSGGGRGVLYRSLRLGWLRQWVSYASGRRGRVNTVDGMTCGRGHYPRNRISSPNLGWKLGHLGTVCITRSIWIARWVVPLSAQTCLDRLDLFMLVCWRCT